MRNSRIGKRITCLGLALFLCLTTLCHGLDLGVFAGTEKLELSIQEILDAVRANDGSVEPFYRESQSSSSGLSAAPNLAVYSAGAVPVVTVYSEDGAELESYAAPELGDAAGYPMQSQVRAFVSGLDEPYCSNQDLLEALSNKIFVKQYGNAIVVIDPVSYQLTFLAVNPTGSGRTYTLTITNEYGVAVELSQVSAIVRGAVVEELDENALARYTAAGLGVEILEVSETVIPQEEEETERINVNPPQPKPQVPQEEPQEETPAVPGEGEGEEPGDNSQEHGDGDQEPGDGDDANLPDDEGDDDQDNDSEENQQDQDGDNGQDDGGQDDNGSADADTSDNGSSDSDSGDDGDSSDDPLWMLDLNPGTRELSADEIQEIQDESSDDDSDSDSDDDDDQEPAEPEDEDQDDDSDEDVQEPPVEDEDDGTPGDGQEGPDDGQSPEEGETPQQPDQEEPLPQEDEETTNPAQPQEDLVVRTYTAAVTRSQTGAVAQNGSTITLSVAANWWGEVAFGLDLVDERFEVTFDPANGQEPFIEKTGPGDLVKEPLNPDKPVGMRTFLGWYLDPDAPNAEPFNFDEPVEGDITLTAKYSSQIYVRYLTLEGKVIHTQLVDYGAAFVPESFTESQLEIPTQLSFQYWYSDAERGKVEQGERPDAFPTGAALYEPVTLWPLAEDSTLYYVYFVSYGSAVDPQLIKQGNKATAPTKPIRPGYEFKHWTTEKDGNAPAFNFNTPITESITLYGVWEAQTVDYTVVYWVEKPNLPMDFDETDRDNYMYAASERFQGTAGELKDAPQMSSALRGKLEETNALLFAEFNANLSDTGKTLAGDGTTVLNAYYTRIVYEVTFDLNSPSGYNITMEYNGGSYSGAQYSPNAKYEMDVSKTFPSQADLGDSLEFKGTGNYTFMYWSPTTDLLKPALWVSKRLTFTRDYIPEHGERAYTVEAIWVQTTPKDYTVDYWLQVLDGEAGEPPLSGFLEAGVTADKLYSNQNDYTQSFIAENRTNFSAKGIDGFEFVKGNTGELPSAESAYHFYYNRLTYDLEFDLRGGQLEDGKLVHKDVPYQTPLAQYAPQGVPTRTDSDDTVYRFGGWYTNAEGDGEPFDFATATMPNEALTLFAVWEPADFTVTFYETRADALKGTDPLVEYGVKRYGSVTIPHSLDKYVPGVYSDSDLGEFRAWLWDVGGVGVGFDFGYVVQKHVVIYGGWNTVGFNLEYDLGASYLLGDPPVDEAPYDMGVLAIVKELTEENREKLANDYSELAFVGWQIDGAGTTYYPGAPVRVFGPLKFIAKYIPLSADLLTMTYHPNYTGSTDDPYSHYAEKDQPIAILGDGVFLREGYKIIGWSDTPGGAIVHKPGDTINPTENMSFYAVWERTTYTVTFRAQNQPAKMIAQDGSLVEVIQVTVPADIRWSAANIPIPGLQVDPGYYLYYWWWIALENPQINNDPSRRVRDLNDMDGNFIIDGDYEFITVFREYPSVDIPNIDFGPHQISSKVERYYWNNGGSGIQVNAPPVTDGWDIIVEYADKDRPLALEEDPSYQLPYDALYAKSTALSRDGFVRVYQGSAESHLGEEPIRGFNLNMSLEVRPGEVVKTGIYSTTLLWTIRFVP